MSFTTSMDYNPNVKIFHITNRFSIDCPTSRTPLNPQFLLVTSTVLYINFRIPFIFEVFGVE